MQRSTIAASQLRKVSSEPITDLVEGPILYKGQKVMMTGGPLSGLAGTLISTQSSLRLAVSVELPRRSVSVEIDRDWVVPVDTPIEDRTIGALEIPRSQAN